MGNLGRHAWQSPYLIARRLSHATHERRQSFTAVFSQINFCLLFDSILSSECGFTSSPSFVVAISNSIFDNVELSPVLAPTTFDGMNVSVCLCVCVKRKNNYSDRCNLSIASINNCCFYFWCCLLFLFVRHQQSKIWRNSFGVFLNDNNANSAQNSNANPVGTAGSGGSGGHHRRRGRDGARAGGVANEAPA